MGDDEVLITDIFMKVTKELENLESEKRALSTMLDDVRVQIKSLDQKESEMRSEISQLMQSEVGLSKKKLELEKNMEKTRKRLQKMSEARKSISEAF